MSKKKKDTSLLADISDMEYDNDLFLKFSKDDEEIKALEEINQSLEGAEINKPSATSSDIPKKKISKDIAVGIDSNLDSKIRLKITLTRRELMMLRLISDFTNQNQYTLLHTIVSGNIRSMFVKLKSTIINNVNDF